MVTYGGILPQGPVCILPHKIQVGAAAEKVHNVLIKIRSSEVLQFSIYHTNPQLKKKQQIVFAL